MLLLSILLLLLRGVLLLLHQWLRLLGLVVLLLGAILLLLLLRRIRPVINWVETIKKLVYTKEQSGQCYAYSRTIMDALIPRFPFVEPVQGLAAQVPGIRKYPR